MKSNLIITYKCHLSDFSKLQLFKYLFKPNKQHFVSCSSKRSSYHQWIRKLIFYQMEILPN